jgi:poly[(R)-3-hydroxyalkanoate] polymerase subunit PhaC
MNGIAAFDSKNIIKELGELSEKTIKGLQTISTIEKIDVGTAPKELVFEEDKLQLYHYVQEAKVTCKVPVLIVYALVNRQYMLDLQPDRSLIRKLLQKGLDIYIIDWGYPTKQDMYVTLDDYIDEYINDCVEFITKTAPAKKVNLMGICQGGTFSTIYAALYPEKVQNLVTLVTPIDFDTHDALLFSWSDYMDADKMAEVFRVVPGEFLNAGFLMMAPFTLNIRKYVEMIDIMEDREKLLNFLRMEKWIFDSPGQAGAAYSRFIKDMYQKNKLVKGELAINGRKVDLKNIKMPLLNIYASSDHLVPPSSTKPLNDLVGSTDKSLYEFKGGHIGVFVGSKSQKELAPNISKWLHDRSLCDDGNKPSGAAPAKGAASASEGASASGAALELGVAASMTEEAGAGGAVSHKAEGLEHTSEVVAEVAEKKIEARPPAPASSPAPKPVSAAGGASAARTSETSAKKAAGAAGAAGAPAPKAKSVKPKAGVPPRAKPAKKAGNKKKK